MERIRSIVRAGAPRATEAISYNMPAFRLGGRFLVSYAAFKNHTSLYPIGDAIKRDHADALEGYETSKGTVRFPLDKPLATALVRRLVKARVAEVRRPKRANTSGRSASSATRSRATDCRLPGTKTTMAACSRRSRWRSSAVQ